MKTIKAFSGLRTVVLVVLCAISTYLVSCKDDTNIGPPVITKVTRTEPLSIAKDSTFTASFANRIIVIHGERLDGLTEVYINGLKSYFNANYTTSTNIIVTIPANVPTAATDPNVPNQIRIVTTHGEATFSFRVLVPAPVVSAVSNEFASPGSTIQLSGSNLYVIQKVIFPGNVQATNVKAATDGTLITVDVPANATTGGKLIVVNEFGADTVTFRDPTGMICDFDTKNTYSWGATTIASDAVLYPGAQGKYAAMEFGNIAAGNWNNWESGRSINLNASQLLPASELANPVANYSMKFELYVKKSWTAGTLMVNPRAAWTYVALYRPWMVNATTTKEFTTPGWITVTIPLNRFLTKKDGKDGTGDPAPNLGALLSATGNGTMQFMFNNDSGVAQPGFATAVDNIRIVRNW